jgi:hypothetical protein
MIQLIHALDMKEGEMYYMKKKNIIDNIIGAVIFVKYQMPNNHTFATITYPYCYGYSNILLNNISVYRYVSREEYLIKVKEKYDATCLNIILKRLINESFEW